MANPNKDSANLGINTAVVLNRAPGAVIILPDTTGHMHSAEIVVNSPMVVDQAAQFVIRSAVASEEFHAGVAHSVIRGVDGVDNITSIRQIDGKPQSVHVHVPRL